jgi:hypothetical protein
MTDAERDLIHEHILLLKNTDRKLSELLLRTMHEREMLVRNMKRAAMPQVQDSCHDFEDELFTIQ